MKPVDWKYRRTSNQYSGSMMTKREAETIGRCYRKIEKIMEAQKKRGVFIIRTDELSRALATLWNNAQAQDRLADMIGEKN